MRLVIRKKKSDVEDEEDENEAAEVALVQEGVEESEEDEVEEEDEEDDQTQDGTATVSAVEKHEAGREDVANTLQALIRKQHVSLDAQTQAIVKAINDEKAVMVK